MNYLKQIVYTIYYYILIIVLNIMLEKFKVLIIEHRLLFFEIMDTLFGSSDLDECKNSFLLNLLNGTMCYKELQSVSINALEGFFKKATSHPERILTSKKEKEKPAVLSIMNLYEKTKKKMELSDFEIDFCIHCVKILYGAAEGNNKNGNESDNQLFIHNGMVELIVKYICNIIIKPNENELLKIHLKTLTELVKNNNVMALYILSLNSNCFGYYIMDVFNLVTSQKSEEYYIPFLSFFTELCFNPFGCYSMYQAGLLGCVTEIIDNCCDNENSENVLMCIMKLIIQTYRNAYCYKLFPLYNMKKMKKLMLFGLQHNTLQYMILLFELFVCSSEYQNQLVLMLVDCEELIPLAVKYSNRNDELGNLSRQLLSNIISNRGLSSKYTIFYISTPSLFTLLKCSDPNVIVWTLYVINNRMKYSSLPNYDNVNDDIVLKYTPCTMTENGKVKQRNIIITNYAILEYHKDSKKYYPIRHINLWGIECKIDFKNKDTIDCLHLTLTNENGDIHYKIQLNKAKINEYNAMNELLNSIISEQNVKYNKYQDLHRNNPFLFDSQLSYYHNPETDSKLLNQFGYPCIMYDEFNDEIIERVYIIIFVYIYFS